MKFGPVPIAEAEGATLAHAAVAGGQRLAKGTVLTSQACAALAAAGHETLIVARAEAGDTDEDSAARQIGQALASTGIEARIASTGRVNLHASHSGLLRVTAAGVNRINRQDPSITLATLADYAVVAPGAMVGTVKIIPFFAPQRAVDHAVAQCRNPVLRLLPFRPLSVALIQTRLPHIKPNVLEKTEEVTRARVSALGGSMQAAPDCPHEARALAAALGGVAEADVVIVFGASAMCDAQDVIPEAIRLAGGTVNHVGMPVDPGNLLVLGKLGKTAIIGAPGCARSPKENGFDWVLTRIFAGLAVTSRDIMRMGVGGLLMEIPSRPRPRLAQAEAVDD